MKRLHEGLDYKLYKIYIWGGLPLLVIYFFVAGLILESRNQLGPAGGPFIIIPLMLWFGGILLYWWWVFLFKGNKELEELAQSPGGGFSGHQIIKELEHVASGDDDLWRQCKRIRKECQKREPANNRVVWVYESAAVLDFCPLCSGVFGNHAGHCTKDTAWDLAVWGICLYCFDDCCDLRSFRLGR
jgi:hypothetical protein